MSDPSDPISRLNAALEGRYSIERQIGVSQQFLAQFGKLPMKVREVKALSYKDLVLVAQVDRAAAS